MKKIDFKKNLKVFLQKGLKQKAVRRVGIGLGLAIVAIAIFFLTFNLAYDNKILPKTYVGKTNFGGLTKEKATEKLAQIISENKDGQIKYSFEDQNYSKKISDLGVDYEKDQTAESLLKIGRSGSLGGIIAEQFRSIFYRNQAIATFRYDEPKLEDFLKEIARTVDQAEHDATIGFKESEPYVEPEVVGRTFPINQNKELAKIIIGSFAFSENAPFVVESIKPKVNTEMANKALDKTKALLGKTLKITAREKNFQINPEDIPGLLEFKVGGNSTPNALASILPNSDSLVPQFSIEKVGSYVDSIAKEVNQEAKDPQFKVDGGKVVTFQAAQTGYEVSRDEAIKSIIAALNSDEVSIELKVVEKKPSIAASDPASAGITELIGEGKTSWRGSPPNRIHNLQLGASKISGTIVKPGEEFSTVKTISPITAAAGFLPELVIKKSTKVEPDIGGGLCQVSTTLFRAVMSSGLKVTARTAHSFRVSYYEPPVGEDATIFDPAPDFRFINNYDTPILIWAFAGSNSLTFQVYGTKDGRTVTISDPVKYDYVQPPAPVYSQSSSMAAGAIRQVERATAGVTTSFVYKVTAKSGDILSNDTFVSKYVPIPDTFIYGEGAAVPGATPAPTPTPTVQGTETPAPAPSPTA